jgi:hypothetical protein
MPRHLPWITPGLAKTEDCYFARVLAENDGEYPLFLIFDAALVRME